MSVTCKSPSSPSHPTSRGARGAKAGSTRGQVFTEYLIVFGMTVGVLVMLAFFLTVFKEYGGRILDLVASEFP